MGKQAFALIEFLVVVSIVAILVGMLLPALSTAREKAKAMKCVANLKQLEQVSAFYTDDNDGNFPSKIVNAFFYPYAFVTLGYLPYKQGAKNTIYLCPSDLTPGSNAGMYFSYGNNVHSYSDSTSVHLGAITYKPFAKPSKLTQTSSMMHFADSYNAVDKLSCVTIYGYSTTVIYLDSSRHLGKVSLSYVDGHAGMVKFPLVGFNTDFEFWFGKKDPR
ncbi:MAG: prepilin-type N-terminal cleavage/methylation domain-containing protein [Lentisphaerae bacterium]|nr:prepilin-type N-terminal cleavage/methylation domain-containing protein [Lentisphaerota bacterium]MCP4102272.1 prepilin-type N-terminal cleavage/methylation domain-containing protein [Lentisphaerota bacterium]